MSVTENFTKPVIGVDIGGTKVRIGLGTYSGEIIKSTTYPTTNLPADEWVKGFINELDKFISNCPQANDAIAIGIGVKGSVNHETQRIFASSVIKIQEDDDICGLISKHYNLPVFIDNDVKAATMSELYYGIGKLTQTFACINVGTGLAMGLIVDGKMIRGVNNNAGEIGNMLFRRQVDGDYYCLETVASGKGFETENKRVQLLNNENSGNYNSHDIVEMAKNNIYPGTNVFENFVSDLALALINIETALDIGYYVLVGGVMNDKWVYDKLIEKINEISNSVNYNIFGWKANIKVSEIGPSYSGVCGACAVAYYSLQYGL